MTARFKGVRATLKKREFDLTPGRPRPLIMGIDPGLTGAISVVDADSKNIIDMIDIPTFDRASDSRSSGYIRLVDIHALSSLIDVYAPHTSLAIIEEPGAMPKQGLSSTFRFGHTCGQIHGVLAGHYIPTFPVKPAVWKLALGLNSNKERVVGEASMWFPGFEYLWELKKHHDRAESAMLAVYGIKFLKNFIELGRKA